MSEFTPGPWSYRSKEDDDWGIVRGPDGWVIAQARAGDPYGANARLIAAAPDLYAALKTAGAAIEIFASESRYYDADQEFAIRHLERARAALTTIRAALAAADGRDVGAKL